MSDVKKKRDFKKFLFFALMAGFFILVGLITALITAGAVKETAGVNFCQSCHSMKPMVDSYKNSVHGGFSESDVVAQCVDCHLPHNSTLGYLIEKAKTGTWAVWAESTHDTSKIDWEEKRDERRHFVYDSGCLHCHKNLLRAIKLNSKAFISHKAYFSKKLKVEDGGKNVLAECVDCHKYVGHYELSKYLRQLRAEDNASQTDTLQKSGKFFAVMENIGTNLKKGSHDYYFGHIENFQISDKEIRDINVTQIAGDIQESKKEKMEKLAAKIEELEKKLHEKLEQEAKAQREKDAAEITLAQKIAVDETNLTHSRVEANISKLMQMKDLPETFKPLQKYLHEPFGRGACQLCHIPDPKKPARLIIKGKISDLCYKCHPLKVKKKYKHTPVNEGNCMDCHDPHQSNTKYLLKAPSKEGLCIKCHDASKAKKSMNKEKTISFNANFIHDPIKKDCLKCHEYHSSNYKYLLKKDIKDLNLCMDCHKDDNKKSVEKTIKMDNMRYRHGAVINSKKGCVECHDPHVSKHKNLLKKSQVALCLSCHDKQIKSNVDDSKMINMKEYLDTHQNWHKPIEDAKKEGGCAACHNPHSSNHFSLLKKSYSASNPKDFICYECHKPEKFKLKYTTKLTKFRNKNANLHFVHAEYKEGIACEACHDEHASKYPSLIRDYTDFYGIKFPLRYIDTPTGGSCLPACHRRFEYNREKPGK